MAARTEGPRYYTTTKHPRQFVSEIMELLGEFGAKSFHIQQEDGEVTAVAFVLDTPRGDLPFRMRPNVPGIRARFDEEGVSPPKHGVEAVAWAQLRHLVELQLEAVESDAVTVYEAFAGWALTSGDGPWPR